MTNRELKILHYNNRIDKLSVHFIDNINLINKAKRKLRKLERRPIKWLMLD